MRRVWGFVGITALACSNVSSARQPVEQNSVCVVQVVHPALDPDRPFGPHYQGADSQVYRLIVHDTVTSLGRSVHVRGALFEPVSTGDYQPIEFCVFPPQAMEAIRQTLRDNGYTGALQLTTIDSTKTLSERVSFNRIEDLR